MTTAERFLCRVAFGLLLSGLLLAVTVTSTGTKFASTESQSHFGVESSPDLNATDAEFIAKMHQALLLQVDLGKLAMERSTSSQVRNLGRRMVADHTEFIHQLRRIGVETKTDVRAETNRPIQPLTRRLRKLPPGEFDKAFVAMVLKHQSADLARFRRARHDAADVRLREFAEIAVPKLEVQIQAARKMTTSGT